MSFDRMMQIATVIMLMLMVGCIARVLWEYWNVITR